MAKGEDLDPIYTKALEECSSLVTQANRSKWDQIEHNFRLGEKVDELVRKARYGEKVIAKLSADLSNKVGKQVYTSHLYECRGVYTHFGSLEEIKNIAHAAKTDLSWNFLVGSVSKEKRKAQKEDASLLADPAYISYLNEFEKSIRKIKRYIRRQDTDDKTRLEIRKGLDSVADGISSLVTELEEKKSASQIKLFSYSFVDDHFALK